MAKKKTAESALQPEETSTPQTTSGPDGAPSVEPDKAPKKPIHEFFAGGPSDAEICARVASDMQESLSGLTEKYCCLVLLGLQNSISTWERDRIYAGLKQDNENKQKDVLLILLSSGGTIEPAYQISKLCKQFARGRFVVVVPREAKSAATLIALGADEIHMGVLGQLGPIDPQLGGLPALGVVQALERIAALSQQFPGSADMFAKYLRQALTVEQIGYCDRIAQSAEQYAHRLLSSKLSPADVKRIAKELVHDYKDHSFVVDIAEAREHLGKEWVKDETPEVAAGEALYARFNLAELYLSFHDKRLLACGLANDPSGVLVIPSRRTRS